jgi:hypothetical protein
LTLQAIENFLQAQKLMPDYESHDY